MSLTEMAGGMGGLVNTVSCVRNAARATTTELAQPFRRSLIELSNLKIYLINRPSLSSFFQMDLNHSRIGD